MEWTLFLCKQTHDFVELDVDFELDADIISRIPIWVMFPILSIGYWLVIALILVVNAIGILLVTNGFNPKVDKISYERWIY